MRLLYSGSVTESGRLHVELDSILSPPGEAWTRIEMAMSGARFRQIRREKPRSGGPFGGAIAQPPRDELFDGWRPPGLIRNSDPPIQFSRCL